MTARNPQQTAYPSVPWRAHLEQLRSGPLNGTRWEQGDHILIAAPTRAGKTTMMQQLVQLRSHVVVFVSKLNDPVFAREFKGWTILREWPKGGPPAYENRILLWPKPVKNNKDATIANQRRVFHEALEHINSQGKRTVVFDEALYWSDPQFLNMGHWISYMHFNGRSSGITLVTLAQRPAWIPVIVGASVTHAFIARTMHADDRKRLGDMGGIDAREVAANLDRLPTRHDYVYVNPQGDAAPVVVNTRH